MLVHISTNTLEGAGAAGLWDAVHKNILICFLSASCTGQPHDAKGERDAGDVRQRGATGNVREPLCQAASGWAAADSKTALK